MRRLHRKRLFVVTPGRSGWIGKASTLSRAVALSSLLLSMTGSGCGDTSTGPGVDDRLSFPLSTGSKWEYAVHAESQGGLFGWEDFARRDSIDAEVAVGSLRYHRVLKRRLESPATAVDTLLLRESGDSLFFFLPVAGRRISQVLQETPSNGWLLYSASMPIDSVYAIADAGMSFAPGESLHVSLSVTRLPPVSVVMPPGRVHRAQVCEYRYGTTYYWGPSRNESKESVRLFLVSDIGVIEEKGYWWWSLTHWPKSGEPADVSYGSWDAILTSFEVVQ